MQLAINLLPHFIRTRSLQRLEKFSQIAFEQYADHDLITMQHCFHFGVMCLNIILCVCDKSEKDLMLLEIQHVTKCPLQPPSFLCCHIAFLLPFLAICLRMKSDIDLMHIMFCKVVIICTKYFDIIITINDKCHLESLFPLLPLFSIASLFLGNVLQNLINSNKILQIIFELVMVTGSSVKIALSIITSKPLVPFQNIAIPSLPPLECVCKV